MPQITKNTLVKKISNFEFYSKGSLSRAIDFWRTNSNQVKKLIEGKQFTKSDFESISKAFSKFTPIYRVKDKFLDENCKLNDKDLQDEFLDICRSYIALQIQFNENFEKNLDYFDSNSSYYKKLKSLFLIRHKKGLNNYNNSLFTEISNLLYESIDIDPAFTDDCCKLTIEYLENVFENKSGKFYNPTTNPERIDFLYKYGKSEFIDILKNNKSFIDWFVSGFFSRDNRSCDIKGINDIIDEIFSSRNVSDENRKNILKGIEPSLSEYIKKVKEYRESEEYCFNQYAKFLNKYKGINENKITELKYEDIDNDYRELYEKYFGDLKDWSFVEFDKYDAKNIEKFIYSAEFVVASRGRKTVLGCTNKLSDEEIKSISEKLKNNSKKLKKYAEDWRKNETGQEININPYEFKVCNLPDDFCDIIEVRKFKEIAERKYDNLFGYAFYNYGHKGGLTGIDEIVRKLYSEISKIKDNSSLNPKESHEKESIDKEITNNTNREPNEDKLIIKQQIEELKRLDTTIDELKDTIDRYYKENTELKELLKKNKIVIEDETNKRLIERRKNYKIIVIGGRDNINNGFKNLSKNKDFLKNLEYEYHLNIDQFKLKGNYEQQKDKKFALGIKTSLMGSTNFVIALQTDHETALLNLIKDNPELNSRITYFGELDENGNISKINQNFSYVKFEYYLKKALEKYETSLDNDLLALG